MRRRWKAVLIAVPSVIVAVVSSLYVFGFPPFYRTVHVTVNQLEIWPGFWVGKRVSVEGRIHMGVTYIPEEVPPYNCMLSSAHASFGILWRNPDYSLGDQNRTVLGIVRYGRSNENFAVYRYYIEAENVTLINTSTG